MTTIDRGATASHRYNIYGNVHKTLRALMADTLTTVGRTDLEDVEEMNDTLAQARALLAACGSHLTHENRFVHAAMEARHPRSAAHTARDHHAHLEDIARLDAHIRRVESTAGQARDAAYREFYLRLALFVADNYTHMHVEETDNNAVLWAHYSDEEILAVEQALVASIAPAEMAALMRWFIPSINAAERAELLRGIRAGAPAEVYDAVLDIGMRHLPPSDRAKLVSALAVPAAA